jgi:hypothetical protein
MMELLRAKRKRAADRRFGAGAKPGLARALIVLAKPSRVATPEAVAARRLPARIILQQAGESGHIDTDDFGLTFST